MKFPVFLLLILFGWSQGWTARAKESPEKANPVFVRSTLSLYDPPTCQLSNKNGLVRQTVCYGETVKITATTSDENATVQWHRQNTTGGWTAVSGATQSNLTTGPGIYKAIFTFGDNSTCETETDTIDYWKAYNIDWNVAACRAQIASVTALPFPTQLDGAGEVSTPVNPEAEINYSWQVIPEPVQASFPTSSNSVYPFTDGFFQDTTLGLHKVILTVSQYGSECISVDTMEVVLLPLNVWADTIVSYGGQPAIAVAHASGGTEPYTYTWSNADSCLTGNCDQARIVEFIYPEMVNVLDGVGCIGNRTLNYVFQPITFPELEIQSITKSTIILKWKQARGASVMIVAQRSLPPFFNPVNGTSYGGSPTWPLAPLAGDSDRILFVGQEPDSTIMISGLDSLTSYYFKIYLVYNSKYYSNHQVSYGFTKGVLGFEDEITVEPSAKNLFLERKKDYQDSITTRNILDQINGIQIENNEEILVPIVFHFVGVPGQQSYELGNNVCRINSAINSLNDFFGNNTPTSLSGNPGKTKIRFCLARYRPDGLPWPTATNGVLLHALTPSVANGISYLADVTSQKNINWMKSNIWSATPWTQVLNIVILESFRNQIVINNIPFQVYAGMYYNVTDISYVRAPFFGSSLQGHNGTCVPDELPSGRSNGDVLAHEVGHQLSLMHTFSSSCIDNNCSEDGDMVCDTPPANGQWTYCSQPNSSSEEFCGNTRAIENVMDYTPDVCQYTFSATEGVISQKSRMRQNIYDWRQNMISPVNLYKWFGMHGCGGTTFSPVSTIKLFKGTYYNCDLLGSSVVVGCTKVYEATGPGFGYQFTLITPSGDMLLPFSPSNTIELNLENMAEGIYGLKCTVIIPGLNPLVLDPVSNLFKVIDCENTLPDKGIWYLDNRCKVGFSSNIGSSSTIESFPIYDNDNSERESIHTGNSADGTFSFYTNGYYLFDQNNIKISGTNFSSVEDESNIAELGYNRVDDILKIDDQNYICLVWFKDRILGTQGFNILRLFRTGTLWQAQKINSNYLVPGFMKFVAGCEADKFRILYTYQEGGENGYRVLEVNSIGWNILPLGSWVSLPLLGNNSIEVASEGTMIATEEGAVFHFDASMAKLSFIGNLNFSTSSLPLINPFFSQRGKFLYYKRMELNGATIFRTEIGTSCGLGKTKSILLPETEGFTFEMRSFAIGPDELMYFPEIDGFGNTTSSLSAIRNLEPSNPEDAIEIDFKKIQFSGSDFRLNFAFQPLNGKSVDVLNQYLKVCQDCKMVRATTNYCSNVTISFGDGTPPLNGNDATHIYTCATGETCSFTISVKENGVNKMQKDIIISEPPTPTIQPAGPLAIMCGSSRTFSFSPYIQNYGYKWEFQVQGETTWSDVSNPMGGSSLDYTAFKPGTLRLTTTHSSGCKSFASVSITINPIDFHFVTDPNPMVCSGSPIPLTYASSVGNLTFVTTFSANNLGLSSYNGPSILPVPVINSGGSLVTASFIVSASRGQCEPKTHEGIATVKTSSAPVLFTISCEDENIINIEFDPGNDFSLSSVNLKQQGGTANYQFLENQVLINSIGQDGIYRATFASQAQGDCPAPLDIAVLGNGTIPPFQTGSDVFQLNIPAILKGNIEIPSGKTLELGQNAHVYIKGQLIIGDPVLGPNFAGGSATGSTIKIRAGGKLNMDAGSLIEGTCNKMWKGIELEVTQSATQFSVLEINGAEIKDAYKGIFTNVSSSAGAFLPWITVQNSTFRNCYFGFDICSPLSISVIRDNVFTSEYTEMASPFDYLRNKQFIRTGKTTTDGLFLTHTGIRFSEPFDLQENNFKNNTFENMAFGVFCDFPSTSLPGFEILIKGQTLFKNCHLAAVYLKGCGILSVENNPIELPDNDGLKFKSSFQMDYLGKTILDNPPFVVNEIGPYFSYGIYHDDGCQVAGRGLDVVNNPIASPSTSPTKFHVGIGLRSTGGANVSILRNEFESLDYGIRPVYHPGNYTLAINGNRLTDNTTAISLARFGSTGSATLDFSLKCNQFKLSCSEISATACDNEPPRKGLVIGEGVRVETANGGSLISDQIGGVGVFNPNNPSIAHPNANDWPVAFGTIRSIFPTSNTNLQESWLSPSNWLSLENNNNNPNVIYKRYKNEFVQEEVDNFLKFFADPTPTFVKTIEPTNPTPGVDYEPSCVGLITDPDPIFPARIAVMPDSMGITSVASDILQGGPWLGDAVPNPAQTKTKAVCFIPKEEHMAILQFIEIGSGKVFSAKPIEERGKLNIEIDLSRFPAGTYGYQVILKNQKLGIKRFVVIK